MCTIQIALVFVFELGILTWHLTPFVSSQFIKWPPHPAALHCPKVHPLNQCRTKTGKNTFPGIGTHLLFHQLHYFLTLHLYTYYLHNATCLMLLIPPIPTVDTSPHRFMSFRIVHSSSSRHYSGTIFAWYTYLRKLVGKRSLKPHKAVLFHSP